MGSRRSFKNESDEFSEYIKAQQIAHRILKKYEDRNLEERRRLFIAEMRDLDLPEEIRARILREFG